ncbi:hypothetical protein [Actinomycetospora straminea]|uniref:Uncharacterized protein n=1 Tax=Actinomycetospora straminea TaxID=663607 RepID=A0ABP9EK46_9PSEU|nr:hypothetical protein [Actinomycetospora straminea]MDD7932226.1 hypothetical protein [Actinomycetospora straminea]
MTATHAATVEPTTAPPAARPPAPRDDVAAPGPALSVPLPWLGTIRLSRGQVVYVGGIVGLTAAGLLDWPIALVIAAGSVLTSDDGSRGAAAA